MVENAEVASSGKVSEGVETRETVKENGRAKSLGRETGVSLARKVCPGIVINTLLFVITTDRENW